MASNAVGPSAYMFHSSGPRLAGTFLTTNSMMLRNDLQLWELLCLLHLHPGRLSHSSLRFGLVCLPADSLSTLNTEWLSCVPILHIQPCMDPQRTPLPTILLLLHDVTADTDVMCFSATCKRGHGNVFTELLPCNSHLCWLHNSGSQQTCDSTNIFELKTYCHVFMTRHRLWICNWIYWTLINCNYK
jgi:hypothetical protein